MTTNDRPSWAQHMTDEAVDQIVAAVTLADSLTVHEAYDGTKQIVFGISAAALVAAQGAVWDRLTMRKSVRLRQELGDRRDWDGLEALDDA